MILRIKLCFYLSGFELFLLIISGLWDHVLSKDE